MNFFFNENCKNAVYIHDFIQNMSTAYRLPTKSVPGLPGQTFSPKNAVWNATNALSSQRSTATAFRPSNPPENHHFIIDL